MTRLYANNFSTTLNGAITDVATTMTLTSVTGFPAVGSGDTAQVTITDGTNTEVVTATAISGSDVTITRGQEGTSGTAFADGDTVEIRATALSFTDVLAGDATPAIAGPLDISASYVYFGGSTTSTAYNINSTGGIPVLQGPANFRYTFTSSSLYMQAGTSWNSVTFTNDSNRLVIKTNNVERCKINDSGVTSSNGNFIVPSDTYGLKLGAGGDATIIYNGNSLVINPQAVGSGNTIISSGNLGIGETSPASTMHMYRAANPGYRISDTTPGASGANSFIFGLCTSTNAFVTGTVAGDSAMAAKSGGKFILGTSSSAGATQTARVAIDKDGDVGIGTTSPGAKLDVVGDIECSTWAKVGTYTVATVPSASTAGAGAMIYVSDETGGAVIAFSDGTDWRRMTDRAVVS